MGKKFLTLKLLEKLTFEEFEKFTKDEIFELITGSESVHMPTVAGVLSTRNDKMARELVSKGLKYAFKENFEISKEEKKYIFEVLQQIKKNNIK